jgi:CRISPR type III-A-associated protein Csm2
MPEERETGTVARFKADGGYGFIRRQRGKDAFVGREVLQRAKLQTLNEGDVVSFTITETDRGPAAHNLRLEKAASAAPQPARSTHSSTPRPNTQTDFEFGPEYLKDGYFEGEGDQRRLRPEVIDTWAMEAAKLLGNRGMKSAQLRRFFGQARGSDAKLRTGLAFESLRAGIYGLKRDVAYQVGRKLVPEEFKQFIDRNVELAVQDERSFKEGFVEHFQSVVAYFVYYFREESGR